MNNNFRMHSLLTQKRWIAVFIFTSFASWSVAASPLEGDAPPQVDLSKAGIQKMVSEIDQNLNSEHLKYRFFMARQVFPLSKPEVIVLLARAQAKETNENSRRWFLYQAVMAFAQCQGQLDKSQTGESLYGPIFQKSEQLANHPQVMHYAVSDLAFLTGRDASGRFGRVLLNEVAVKNMAKEVFPHWIKCKTPFYQEAGMNQFAKHFEMSEYFDREIEATSNTLTGFAPQRRAGLFYAGVDSDKTRAYLERAEAMAEFSDLHETKRKEFYKHLVTACSENGDDDAAIRYQKKSITSCSGSRAILAGLYDKTGQTQKREETINLALGLALADSDHRKDVLQVIHFLVTHKREADALSGLEAVLAHPDTPDDLITYAQRLQLMELYEKQDRPADADRILGILDGRLSTLDIGHQRMYKQRIEKTRKRLDASR